MKVPDYRASGRDRINLGEPPTDRGLDASVHVSRQATVRTAEPELITGKNASDIESTRHEHSNRAPFRLYRPQNLH